MNREDLDGARRKLWHADSEALLTYEDVQGWLNEMGWVRVWDSGGIAAPVLLTAVAGETAGASSTEARTTAKNLIARLIAHYEAMPMLWDGASAGATDDFDTLVSVRLLPFVYALYGDREFRKAPDATPLAKAIWKLLAESPMSALAIADGIGGGITEGAVLRQLRDLWTRLRVVALPAVEEQGVTLWTRPDLLWPREIAQGAATAQPMALSAMVSQYLQTSIAASEDEIEATLSPCSSKSRVRGVVQALQAARELQIVPVERQTCYALTGGQAETMRKESDDREREALRVAREEHAAKLAAGEGFSEDHDEAGAMAEDNEHDEIAHDGAEAGDAEHEGAAGGEDAETETAEPSDDDVEDIAATDGGNEVAGEAPERGKPIFRPIPRWVKTAPPKSRIPDGSRPRPSYGGSNSQPSERPRPPRQDGDAPRPFRPREDGDRPARPFAPRGDRPFTPRGDRPFTPRGDRPFTPRGDRPFTPRGDRPFQKREGGAGGDRPFRKPFTPREGAAGGERREWKPRAEGPGGPRREWTPRKPEGEGRPFTPRDGDSPRPPRPGGFGSRPGFGPRRDSGGPPKPWQKREGGSFRPRADGDAPRRPFDPDRKPFERKPFDPNRKPFERKPFDPNRKPFERKPFSGGDRKPFSGDRKPFSGGDRKPFGGDRPFRPAGDRPGGFDRPSRPRPDGDAPRREWQNRPTPGGGSARPAGDAAPREFRPRPSGGAGRPSFGRKPGGFGGPRSGPGGPRFGSGGRPGGAGGSRFGGPPKRFGSGGPGGPKRPFTPRPKPEGDGA